ncbi:MAG TPA: hypothetical protein VKW06_13390 [Candidatus Angelobacter sp.]|nr:hypothetical protein [Candidatus Angelobacter sp.]
MSTDHKILNGFVAGLILTAVTLLVGFVQFRLLLHYLPTETVGIWMVFISIGGYILFLDLGLVPTLGREISFISADKGLTEEQRLQQMGTLIRSCTATCALLGALVFLAGVPAGWAYLKTLGSWGGIRPAWIIFAAGGVFTLVGEIWPASIYGMGHVAAERLIRTGGQIVWLLLTVVALILGFGLEGLAFAWLLQALLSRFAARYLLGRFQPGVLSAGKFDFGRIRAILGPSVKFAILLLGGALLLQTDNLVIASEIGAQTVPGFQIVAKLVTTIGGLSMMLVVTTTPFVSQAHMRQDPIEIKRLMQRNLRYSLSVIGILGCFVGCFADRIVSLWVGAQYFIGFGVVWTLLIVMLLDAHQVAMTTATIATGRIAFVHTAVIACVLNLLFCVFLARRFGLLGVPLGTLCAQGMTNDWYGPFYTLRYLRIGIVEHARVVILPFIKLLVAVLAIALAVRLATNHASDIIALFTAAGCVGSTGLIIFGAIMLSPQERTLLFSQLQAKSAKIRESARGLH